MDFILTEQQHAIQQLARDFAMAELAPQASAWDATGYFPVEVLRKAASLGLAGLYVDTTYGGAAVSRLEATLVFEALATACVSTAAYLSIHNMVTWLLANYANESQRLAWLPVLCSMDKLASYCLTEPNAGSDAASLQTKAVKSGDHYIVNGAKAFISGGGVSDVYACMVRTSEDKTKGITCLLIEKDTPGLRFGEPEKKLGWCSQPTSMLYFDNCKVPSNNRIGMEGDGFKIALSALDGGRINIAACSLGGAQTCLALAREHVLQRQQFARPLAQQQTIQFKLADMLTELDAAKLMVYRAASAMDQSDQQSTMYSAMAKRFATDVGFKVVDQALQLFGGYGYLKDYPLERFFRDLRVHQILEGTNEIMRVVIAKHLLAGD